MYELKEDLDKEIERSTLERRKLKGTKVKEGGKKSVSPGLYSDSLLLSVSDPINSHNRAGDGARALT